MKLAAPAGVASFHTFENQTSTSADGLTVHEVFIFIRNGQQILVKDTLLSLHVIITQSKTNTNTNRWRCTISMICVSKNGRSACAYNIICQYQNSVKNIWTHCCYHHSCQKINSNLSLHSLHLHPVSTLRYASPSTHRPFPTLYFRNLLAIFKIFSICIPP